MSDPCQAQIDHVRAYVANYYAPPPISDPQHYELRAFEPADRNKIDAMWAFLSKQYGEHRLWMALQDKQDAESKRVDLRIDAIKSDLNLMDLEEIYARVYGPAKMQASSETHISLSVEVFERRGEPGVWSTEAIGSDGEIYQAIFIGPDAEARAQEYAKIYDSK